MEWTDIINEVLDEQVQPATMADVMKNRANDNMRNQLGGGGAGGGWSGRIGDRKFTGNPKQPLKPDMTPPTSKGPPVPLEEAGPKGRVLRGLGYPNKWLIDVPSYVPRAMNKNVRGPRGFAPED